MEVRSRKDEGVVVQMIKRLREAEAGAEEEEAGKPQTTA